VNGERSFGEVKSPAWLSRLLSKFVVMSLPPDALLDDERDDSVLVRAKALTKHFGDQLAVDGVDFGVRRGEVFGFLGPNGAGKTTIMRMIACVSPVTDGHLSVLGMDPRREAAIRARLGVVPQEDNLDTELTVADNLLIYGRYFGLPVSVIRERVTELLAFARLDDRRDSRVDPLSGGMKRRLTIARALINRPDLVLLDEPTTGLDPRPATCCGSACTGSSAEGVTLVLTTTTWTRPSSFATGSSSWTRAASWPRARPAS
jgi:lipooligosaccharide transport system ATP-binding protein